MIKKDEITLDWLHQVSKKYRNVDKILVEKTIRALLLLEGLAKQKIDFVFKGGTALMLHFNSTKRLSLDIDIVISKEIPNFETHLDSIVSEQGFLRKELQQRNAQSTIKKEHYKFFYNPLHKTNQTEEYVLLDVLYENVNYSHLISIPVQSDFVPVENEPETVFVPSLEDMLGDKLTAFAPNTTGIPYFKHGNSMGMEIIKQLYDIAQLADIVTDIEIIKKTFSAFAKTELTYRNCTDKTEIDVLNDIYQSALCIVSRGTDGNGNFEELQKGIQRISGMIFSEGYHIEKAITQASKAAYFSTLIRYNATKIDKFDNPLQMKGWIITEPLDSKLNKLKKSNPEAFFYWYKIYELKKQHI